MIASGGTAGLAQSTIWEELYVVVPLSALVDLDALTDLVLLVCLSVWKDLVLCVRLSALDSWCGSAAWDDLYVA